jgi:hypothetical protein
MNRSRNVDGRAQQHSIYHRFRMSDRTPALRKARIYVSSHRLEAMAELSDDAEETMIKCRMRQCGHSSGFRAPSKCDGGVTGHIGVASN